MIFGVEASGGNPPPRPPVDTGAVIIDNTTPSNGVVISSQTATDSPLLTLSAWVWISDISASPKVLSLANGASYWKGSLLAIQYNNKILVNLKDEALDLVGSQNFTTSSWNHIFMSLDTNHAINTKLYNILLNGTADASITAYDTGGAFDIPINGKAFGIPTYESELPDLSYEVRLADVWIAHGQYLTAADVTKFRTAGGARVDLGADGSIPTGTPPTYYFRGGASNFITNRGTGDAVSLVGSISDAPDAPPGP